MPMPLLIENRRVEQVLGGKSKRHIPLQTC